jgi:hypothetical protein
VPDRETWTLVVNRSTRQWGLTRPERGAGGRLFDSAYSPSVRAAELGRVPIATRSIPHVEQLTARAEVQSADTSLLLIEWETTQIEIPIRVAQNRR